MSDRAALSVVVPAYNEEALLPALLASLAVAQQRCAAAGHGVEVIVANNASTDGSAALARAHGARVVDVPERCIAAARNGGAAMATADHIAFVDADSQVHPDALEVLLRALASPGCVGGASGVTVQTWSLPLRLMQGMTAPARWLGIDAGLVFCRRADFEALGGYDTSLRVAEDVDFLLRLRRHGARSGQRLKRLRGVETLTSTRKFDRHGHWHFLGTMAAMALLQPFSKSRVARLVQRYWYEDR